MKKDNKSKAEHKYLTYGISIGLLVGTTFAIITDNWIGMGAGLGILLGVVIGTTVDYEIKKKNSDE